MKVGYKKKEEKVYILLRRMRESADLTMREVGAMIGVSHVTITRIGGISAANHSEHSI